MIKSRQMAKHEFGMAVILLVAAVLIVFAGCASSPEARWAQARETLTIAQDTAMILHESGAITDEDMVHRVAPAVYTARAAISRAEELLPDGPGVHEMMDIAEAALRRLVEIRMEYTDDQ